MKDYQKYFSHLKRSDNDGVYRKSPLKQFKKIFIITGVLLLVLFIVLVTLLIIGFSWLFNKDNDIKQAAGEASQQVQRAVDPINLESYIENGTVNTAQLEQTFNQIPAQLQGVWLNQFEAQLDELKQNSGISDSVLQELNSTYDKLQNNQ